MHELFLPRTSLLPAAQADLRVYGSVSLCARVSVCVYHSGSFQWWFRLNDVHLIECKCQTSNKKHTSPPAPPTQSLSMHRARTHTNTKNDWKNQRMVEMHFIFRFASRIVAALACSLFDSLLMPAVYATNTLKPYLLCSCREFYFLVLILCCWEWALVINVVCIWRSQRNTNCTKKQITFMHGSMPHARVVRAVAAAAAATIAHMPEWRNKEKIDAS